MKTDEKINAQTVRIDGRGNVSRTRYDAACRRIARAHTGTAFAQPDAINYAYDIKSELTNAVASVDSNYTYAYDFDEIGNRRTSSECGVRSAEYASNELNQYTAISTDTSALFVSPRETFTPLFDADGNQTLVKTATGIWQVTYNGENRPIVWERIEQPVLNSLGAYKGGSYSCLYKCGDFGFQSKDYYAPCKKIQLWRL